MELFVSLCITIICKSVSVCVRYYCECIDLKILCMEGFVAPGENCASLPENYCQCVCVVWDADFNDGECFFRGEVCRPCRFS